MFLNTASSADGSIGFQFIYLNFPVVSLVSQLNSFEIRAKLSILLDLRKGFCLQCSKIKGSSRSGSRRFLRNVILFCRAQ